MAYDFDETSPADNDYISDYPANERAARTAKKNAFEVDHELTDGFHDVVTLNETPWAAADPDPGAGHMAFYCKDHGGQPEAFIQEESAGDIIQLTEAGYLYAVMSLLAGSPVSARKVAAAMILANTVELQAESAAGGTYHNLIKMLVGDTIEVGDVNVDLAFQVASLANFEVDDGGGAHKILTDADEGTGNGLDADRVDGIEGADLLGWDSDHYFESSGNAITTGASGSFAHGLLAVPRLIVCELVCTSADLGYTAGDVVPIVVNPGAYGSGSGIAIWADGTNIGYKVSAILAGVIVNKSTGAANYPTGAKWTLSLRCWK